MHRTSCFAYSDNSWPAQTTSPSASCITGPTKTFSTIFKTTTTTTQTFYTILSTIRFFTQLCHGSSRITISNWHHTGQTQIAQVCGITHTQQSLVTILSISCTTKTWTCYHHTRSWSSSLASATSRSAPPDVYREAEVCGLHFECSATKSMLRADGMTLFSTCKYSTQPHQEDSEGF